MTGTRLCEKAVVGLVGWKFVFVDKVVYVFCLVSGRVGVK